MTNTRKLTQEEIQVGTNICVIQRRENTEKHIIDTIIRVTPMQFVTKSNGRYWRKENKMGEGVGNGDSFFDTICHAYAIVEE